MTKGRITLAMIAGMAVTWMVVALMTVSAMPALAGDIETSNHADAGAALPDGGAPSTPATDVDASDVDASDVDVDAGALDAGVAGFAPSPERTPTAAPDLPREVAAVHERPSPLVFRVPAADRDPKARARAASTALQAALSAEASEDAPLASVRVEGEVAMVTVRGRAVALLTRADAEADGATLERYAAVLETRLQSYVQGELRRVWLQTLALQISLSVLFAVLGLLTLRALRNTFARAEKNLEDSQPNPLVFLGTPVLSSDALRGLLLLGLAAGRVLAFVGVALAVLLAMFGQFETTRPLIGRAATRIAAPLVRGLDALVQAIPGILLAIALVFTLRALLRFAEILLDGIAEGRVTSKMIDKRRVRPARALVALAATLGAAPLVAAAAFGRFGSPLESLALGAGMCVLVASIPAVASVAAGILVTWRGTVIPGDWVEIGGVRGEVTAVQLFDVVVVPETGGTVSIPMAAFVVLPVRRSPSPRVELVATVTRDRPLASIEEALLSVARAVDPQGGVELKLATATTLRCVLFVPVGKPGAQSALVRALVTASEEHAFQLAEPAGPP